MTLSLYLNLLLVEEGGAGKTRSGRGVWGGRAGVVQAVAHSRIRTPYHASVKFVSALLGGGHVMELDNDDEDVMTMKT